MRISLRPLVSCFILCFFVSVEITFSTAGMNGVANKIPTRNAIHVNMDIEGSTEKGMIPLPLIIPNMIFKYSTAYPNPGERKNTQPITMTSNA